MGQWELTTPTGAQKGILGRPWKRGKGKAERDFGNALVLGASHRETWDVLNPGWHREQRELDAHGDLGDA